MPWTTPGTKGARLHTVFLNKFLGAAHQVRRVGRRTRMPETVLGRPETPFHDTRQSGSYNGSEKFVSDI
eukprot:1271648-Alexandrium_andersonii.AAC.1